MGVKCHSGRFERRYNVKHRYHPLAAARKICFLRVRPATGSYPSPLPPLRFLFLPIYVQDCAELVWSLLPYSERHFQRLDRLLQSSYLVEYTLVSVQMLLSPDPNGAAVACSGRGKTLDMDPRVRRRPLEQEPKRLRDKL